MRDQRSTNPYGFIHRVSSVGIELEIRSQDLPVVHETHLKQSNQGEHVLQNRPRCGPPARGRRSAGTLYFPRTGWRAPVISMSSPRSRTQRTARPVLGTNTAALHFYSLSSGVTLPG